MIDVDSNPKFDLPRNFWIFGPSMAARHRVLVTCVPGLEELVTRECRQLGIRCGSSTRGSVGASDVTSRQLYTANHLLRTASGVLVEAGAFRARTFPELDAGFRRIARDELAPWLGSGVSPQVVGVQCKKSRLYHQRAIAERVERWLGADGGGAQPRQHALRLVLRLEHDQVRVLVDASGAPLHERGWRAAAGDAGKMPLKASVASGLLQGAGWADAGWADAASEASMARSRGALLDPFCGGGTIPIEAALLAIGQPPHAHHPRAFAHHSWLCHEAEAEAAAQALVDERAHKATRRRAECPRIWGSDRDAGAVAAARRNAERAGVADLIEWSVASVSDAGGGAAGATGAAGAGGGAAADGLLATNPPWARRSAGGGDLRNLYARLGSVAAGLGGGWSAAVLVGDRSFARQVSPTLKTALSLLLGGRPAWLVSTRGRESGGATKSGWAGHR